MATKQKQTDNTAVTRSEHVLLKPFTHGSKLCAKGDEIALRPDQAERLRKYGIIK